MVQENSVKPQIVVVVGPTASGKTSLGVKLAKEFNGEIISADSMQIYKAMNIGTAKVTNAEMQGVVHHLIDIVNPTDSFSVAEWVDKAKNIIADITTRGKLPIIVGGTGLYISSLLNGYNFHNVDKSSKTREYYTDLCTKFGADYVYDILKSKAPDVAKNIDKSKTKAVIRALEVIDTTGEFNYAPQEKPYNALVLGLDVERSVLYDRINARVDEMLNLGLIDECKSLIANYGLNNNSQSAGAIGYKEIFPYLRGEISYDDMVNQIKQHSRNYAKRQVTWFKRVDNLIWVKPTNYTKIEKLVTDFLGDTNGNN